MSHVYKQAPRKDVPLSFVKAVTEKGDDWRMSGANIPIGVFIQLSEMTFDYLEAGHMRLMERGEKARVE